MFLKELTLKGFKSFLNTTKLSFFDGVTAIVGPNGSGKSNISDAIRWVLGESSAKTLRGNKMEDVIFTGTDDIKPVGFAEVIIKFTDCNLQKFPYSEVVVKRRVYRDGESEYYINNNKVRLKDIREVFMDTGLGRDGYSIIGQGQIEQVLSTKPEDRRFIFEEASGISKFRYKKEESLSKLNKSEDDLQRLSDIYNEIKKNYNRLEKESEKAKLYTELAIRKNTLELDLIYLNINKYNVDKEKFNKDLDVYLNDKKRQLDEIENKKNELKSLSEEIENLSKKIDEINLKKVDVYKKFSEEKMEYKLSLDAINRLENDIKDLEEKEVKINQELSSISENSNELKFILDSSDLSGLTDDDIKKRDELLEILASKEKELESLREEIIRDDISFNRDKVNYESNNDKIEFYKNKIASINEEVSILRHENEELYNKRDLIVKSLNEENSLRDELFRDYEEYKRKFENIKQSINHFNEENFKLRNIYSEIDYKIKTKNNIINQYQLSGFSNKKINEKFKDNPGYLGEVSYNIEVSPEYTKAIETALGGKLNYIITKTQNDAKEMVKFLKREKFGRATFLPLDMYKKNVSYPLLKTDEEVLGYAYDFISTDDEYKNLIRNLVGGIVVFKDLDSATKRRNQFKSSIVTLDGEFLHFSGSITGGEGKREQMTPLSIKNEINELKRDLINCENKISNLGNKEEIYVNYKNAEDKISSISEALTNKDNKRLELKNSILVLDNKLSSNEERINRQLNEIESLNISLQNIDVVEVSDEFIVKKKKEYEFKNKEFLEFKASTNEVINAINAKETDQKLFLFKKESAKEKLKENNLSKDKLLSELNGVKIKLEESNISLVDKRNQSKDLFKRMTEFEELEKEVDLNTNRFIEERTELKAKESSTNIQIDSMRNDLNQIDEKINLTNLRLARIDENISMYKKELPEERNIDFDKFINKTRQTNSIKEINDSLKGINKEIDDMGPVNMSAISEFKDVSERKNFYESQINDCNESIKDLEKIIRDINRDMKSQFNKAFEEIRINFKSVFLKLFNGGDADLTLVDPDDPLNSGIHILAKPPGKKEQHLSLLSGGEKTLTAMALLFSFLKLKPSPFCILDEIDAALDDANIMRYTEFLDKLSKESQFLIITHRKPSLEVADTIYGVCMRKKGVSDIISIKFEDYEE